MSSSIIGGLVAFAVGAAAACLTAALTRRAFFKKPNSFASFSIVRQLIHIACLVLVYLLAPYLPWERIPMLIGAAFGITIISTAFSFRLARLNDAMQKGKDPADKSTKGE